MHLHHVTIATAGRAPLYTGEPELRALLHRVCRACGARLVLFCVVDDHVHLVLEHSTGRHWSQIRRALGVALQAPHGKPVVERRHLLSLVRYVVEQPAHHGVRHGALARWPGSCVADLVGARLLVRGLPERLMRWLPRWRPESVWEHVGLPVLAPADDAQVFASGPAATMEAAARVFATEVPAAGARVAAVHLMCGPMGLTAAQIAPWLGAHATTIRRDLRSAPDAVVMRALRLDLAIREHLVREALDPFGGSRPR